MKSLNSFVDHPLGEWCLDATTSVEILIDLLRQLGLEQKLPILKVLLPGIGKSKLAKVLYDWGIVNLTLWDIDEESLRTQRAFFEGISTVQVCAWDALTNSSSDPEYSPSTASSFDLIVDKGFMDVFLRQGHSVKVMKHITSHLAPHGIYLAFSMFHKKWRRCFPKDEIFTLYGYTPQPRYSRTRPTVVSYHTNIAVIAAIPYTLYHLLEGDGSHDDIRQSIGINEQAKRSSKKRKRIQANLTSVRGIPLRPLHEMHLLEFPVDAEHF